MKKFTLFLCSLLLSACTVTSSPSTVHPSHSAIQEAARALLNQAVTAYHAQDYAQALPLFRQSAQRGDVITAPAMVALGRLYEQGKGVAADRQQALAYYQQAKNAGDAQGEAEWQRLQTVH
ncbi:sel1 repeat family protein [Avibacterium paragallinarum]|uniref:sel1 repeat family protein n=1 Tax=Avibacterium paragallinarum TaxID=728 RepID=UPI00021AD047|nr:sel1 repeat family protein [Avibacterium paragallinarum]